MLFVGLRMSESPPHDATRLVEARTTSSECPLIYFSVKLQERRGFRSAQNTFTALGAESGPDQLVMTRSVG